MSLVLGLDFGTKHIGIARGYTETRLASSVGIWPNDQNFGAKLAEYVRAEHVTALVVGLPLNLEGNETAATAQARQFGQQLALQLKLPLHFQAETATTVAGRKRSTKTRVDDEAAVIILEDFFNEPIAAS